MIFSFLIRRVRRLSTAALSYRKLRKVNNPDEALKIYAAVTNNPSISPVATRYAKEYTVRCLAKFQRFSDIEQFLESHKSHKLITDESFLSSLIRSYGIAGMFENALKTYNQMEELGTPRSSLSFNTLLTACLHCEMFDRVPGYFDGFPAKFGFLPDKVSYDILIKSYCGMDLLDAAMETLSEMEKKGFEVTLTVFTPVLKCLYENGRRNEAERFWDEMVMNKGLNPDVRSCNVKLLHMSNPSPENVKRKLDEMRDNGVKPDVNSYNCLLTCYCENGMLDEATNIYNQMSQEKCCIPNLETYKTMMFYMCKQNQFLEAYKIFHTSAYNHKIPDFNTLKCLAVGLTKNRCGHAAKYMIKILKVKTPPDKFNAWEQLTNDLGLVYDD